MKKLVFVMLCILLALPAIAQKNGYYTGSGGAGQVILLDKSVLINGKKDKSDIWLSQSAKSDVLNDLSQYSAIKMLEAEQQRNVLKLQKESESVIYDDEDVLELGKMLKAKRYITLTTTRLEQNGQSLYSLSATIVNITTGNAEGGYNSKNYYTQNEFVLKAHGELSLGLLEQLGVQLTETGKRLIASSSLASETKPVANVRMANFSASQIREAQENLNAMGTELKRMEAQLADIENRSMSDIERKAERLRLEAQKEALEQQQRNEAARLERMKADEARKIEAAEKAKKQTKEQQQKIDALSAEIEAKSLVLAEKASRSDIEERIITLEKQKQVYAENEAKIEESVKAAKYTLEGERKLAVRERNEQKPPKAELTADGKLTKEGERRRDDDISAINKKYDELISQTERDVRANFGSVQETLFQSILSEQKQIAKGDFTASIAGERVFLTVNEFDAEKKGWNYDISMQFNKSIVWKKSGMFSYREVTGKDAATYPERGDKHYDKKLSAYKEYQETVEQYDSLFRMNVPVFAAEVQFTIKAAPYNRPSEYDITVQKVRFENVLQTKNVSSVQKIEETVVYRFKPSSMVDWRTDKEKEKDEHDVFIARNAQIKALKARHLGFWLGFCRVILVIVYILFIVGIIIAIVRSGNIFAGLLVGLILSAICGYPVIKLKDKVKSLKHDMAEEKRLIFNINSVVFIDRVLHGKTFFNDNKDRITFINEGELELFKDGNSTVLHFTAECENHVYHIKFDGINNYVLRFFEVWGDSILLLYNTEEKDDVTLFYGAPYDAQYNSIVQGRSFEGKWSEKYKATITFGENGKASVVFDDGDKASGDYVTAQNGSYVLYRHRNKGDWRIFLLNSSGNSITLVNDTGYVFGSDWLYRWQSTN